MTTADVMMPREGDPGATNQNTHGQTTDVPSGVSGAYDGEGSETRWKDLSLAPQHVAMLDASGITSDQVRLQGCETILGGQRLGNEFGFPEQVVQGALQAQTLSATGDRDAFVSQADG